MPIVQKNKIIFDHRDWEPGLIPNWSSDLDGNQAEEKGLSTMKSIHPFRAYPYLVPGFNPTNATDASVITTFLRNGVVNGNFAYCVSNGDLIHKVNIVSATMSVIDDATWPYQVTHGADTNLSLNDCVLYNSKIGSTSTLKMFYSWSDSADWNIGSFNLNATFDDDFMSTVPDAVGSTSPLQSPYTTDGKGKPHPLIVGDDDVLYVGDRNFLHAYDGQVGTNGIFYPAVLTLPGSYIITSIAKVTDGLMIFTYLNSPSSIYLGKAVAWLWKYGELDITRSYQLNDNLVSESFEFANTVGCFTQGRITDPANLDKTSKLQLFDGTRFISVAEFYEDIPIRGGVDVTSTAIYWNAEGRIYAYGELLRGMENGFYGIYETSNASSTGVSGMLKTFNAVAQAASGGTGTSGGLQSFFDDFQASCNISTQLAAPAFSTYKTGKIKNVKIRLGDTVSPSDCRSLAIQLRDRDGFTLTQLPTITSVTVKTLVRDFNYDSSNAQLIFFDALKMVAVYDTGTGANEAPPLASVEVEFEEVNIRS